MFCRNCGKEINSEARFCPSCGAEQVSFPEGSGTPTGSGPLMGDGVQGESGAFTEESAYVENGSPMESGMPAQPYYQTNAGMPELEPKGNRKKTLLIAGIAALVIVLAAGAGVLFGSGILGGSQEAVADKDDEDDRENEDDQDDTEDKDTGEDEDGPDKADDREDAQADKGDGSMPRDDRDKKPDVPEGEEDKDGLDGFLDKLGGKQQSATYTMEQEASGILIRDTMTLNAKGDDVQEIVEVMEVDMTSMDASDCDMLVEMYEEIVEQYRTVAGVTATSSYTDQVYYINVVIDTTGDAVEKLADLGLLSVEGDASGISLEASGSALEAGGYTKVE